MRLKADNMTPPAVTAVKDFEELSKHINQENQYTLYTNLKVEKS